MYSVLDKEDVLKEGARNEVGPFLAQKRGPRDLSGSGSVVVLMIHQADAVIVKYLISLRTQHHGPQCKKFLPRFCRDLS